MSSSGRMSESAWRNLADRGFCIVPDFLPVDLRAALRQDLFQLRKVGHFQVAKIGHDGMVMDSNTPFKDVRHSETCFIGRTPEAKENNQDSARTSLPSSSARDELYGIVDNLRGELGSNTLVTDGICTRGVPKLDDDMEELMYAYYPNGGYYRRHRDAEMDSMSTLRKYSFLMYLNEDWDTPRDGGQLRIHLDSGDDELPVGELPNYIDVEPHAGTLVVFRSDLCPHEVIDTRRERCAIVGWFVSSLPMNMGSGGPTAPGSFIDPKCLKALQALKDAAPRLAAKLKPTPPPSHSGLIGDDFGFGGFPGFDNSQQEAELPEFEESDPQFWKKIATFDHNGKINTLSLGSNRLRTSIDALRNADLLASCATLDLASTDLSVDEILSVIELGENLKQLHLGGNGFGENGMNAIVDSLVLKTSLSTLDVRYNDLGSAGGQAVGRLLMDERCSLDVLYAEGNVLGDEGVAFLAPHVGRLREVYLGQNQIGPVGAQSLSKGLKPRLKKLYIEGNHIGDEGALHFCSVLEKDNDIALEKLYADMNGIDKATSLRLGKAVNSPTMVGNGALQD